MITTAWSVACVCPDMNEEQAKELYQYADYIIVGRAVSASDPDPQYEKLLNERRESSDVIFQVDSVLKGDLQKGERIFIYQNEGSCTETFEIGGSYLVLGSRIEKIKKVDYGSGRSSSGEFLPPPHPEQVKNGVLQIDTDWKEGIKYLNEKLKKYKVVTTNMCFFMQNLNPVLNS